MKAKNFKSRHALLMSLTSLMLCVSMLFGATFAWFTDSVSSGVNRIVSGNLDVTLKHASAKTAEEDVTNTTELFTDIELWEPGAYVYETFTVGNAGNLALKYQMKLNAENPTGGVDLRDVIKVTTASGAVTTREQAAALPGYTTLNAWSWTGANSLLPGASDTITVVLYWAPNADSIDNQYNVADEAVGLDVGVTLVATQFSNESDSFGIDYDANATYPTIEGVTFTTVTNATANADVVAEQPTVLTAAVAPVDSSTTSVVFEADKLTANTTASLTVETKDIDSASPSTFVVEKDHAAVASIDLKLVEITTIKDDQGNVTGTQSNVKTGDFGTATITTYIAKGLSDVAVKYDGEGAQPTLVSYDSETGKLVFTTTHFSNYVVTAKEVVAYNLSTNTAYASLAGAFAAAKESETIVLLKNVETGSEYTIASPLKLAAKGATLDLNGKTITVTNNFSLCMSADNIIVKNGSIESAPNANKRTNMNSYVLVLGGIEKADKVSGITISGITMKGGMSAGGDSGANVKGVAENVTIKDCNITSGDYYAVCSQNRSSVTIESGTYISNQESVNAGKGNPPQGVLQGSFIDDDGPEGQIIVIGGTFNGEIKATNKDWISITGGTFDHDPSSYVASGYTVNRNDVDNPTSWTVLSETDALAAKAAAAGATNIAVDVAVDGTGVVGTMSDGVVYKWKADGTVYIKDASGYNGNNGTGITDSTYYIVGGLVSVNGIIEGAFLNANISKVKFTSNLESAWKGFCGSANSEANTHLTTVEFSDVVTEIPARVFCNCTALESITIPDTITKIGEGAFRQSGLTSITIPASVQTIDKEMVAYCPNITAVTFAGSPAINQYYIGRASAKLANIYFMGADTKFTYAKCITFSHTEGGVANGITVHFVNEALKNAFEGVNSSTQMTLTVDNQA